MNTVKVNDKQKKPIFFYVVRGQFVMEAPHNPLAMPSLPFQLALGLLAPPPEACHAMNLRAPNPPCKLSTFTTNNKCEGKPTLTFYK
jgi:hypothetical protein